MIIIIIVVNTNKQLAINYTRNNKLRSVTYNEQIHILRVVYSY
jgi:hypothetical protein